MRPQSAFIRRCIITLVAFVKSFSAVGFQMCPEMTCRGERAKEVEDQRWNRKRAREDAEEEAGEQDEEGRSGLPSLEGPQQAQEGSLRYEGEDLEVSTPFLSTCHR